MRSSLKPRHSCRSLPVVALVAAALAGCTTTTRLGPAGAPETARVIQELATQGAAYARVAEPPPVVEPIYSVHAPTAIVEHEPGWLTLSKQGGPVRVPLTQVQSVSTYNHARGALEGAAVTGAVGLVLGFAAGAIMIPHSCNADGSCDSSIPIGTRLGWGAKVGAVFGAFTAVLGATVGAIQGHEMRYELEAP